MVFGVFKDNTVVAFDQQNYENLYVYVIIIYYINIYIYI